MLKAHDKRNPDMITAILLFPVVAILVWIYWYFLPFERVRGRRWRWIDTALLLTLIALATVFVHLAMNAEYEGAGPMWPELVSAVGAYAISATGLMLGLVWRRRRR